MPLNFDAMPLLIGPKRRNGKTLADEREAFARMKLRQTRNHQKRHSTNRERSRGDRAKARMRKLATEKAVRASAAYHAAVRAYWLGERESHP